MRKFNDLVEKFNMDGNGKLEKSVKVSDFEQYSRIDLKKCKRETNEYGGDDILIKVLDEDGSDIYITIEVNKGYVTHSYY